MKKMLSSQKQNPKEEIAQLRERVKELEKEVLKVKKLALVGTMASSIAHEIKNPLVAIKTFFDLLPTKYQDPEFRDGFSLVVKREVERINELVIHLLDFARPKKPVFGKVNLTEVLEETIDLLSLQIKDANVKIKKEMPCKLPEVKADREQIRRVFMNIVLNGVQAMHEGGILAIVATPNHKAVQIDFGNNGPEIPKEILSQIFNPFFSTKHKGSGLGLSICQEIILNHRGKIKVQSSPKGTCFSLSLPKYS